MNRICSALLIFSCLMGSGVEAASQEPSALPNNPGTVGGSKVKPDAIGVPKRELTVSQRSKRNAHEQRNRERRRERESERNKALVEARQRDGEAKAAELARRSPKAVEIPADSAGNNGAAADKKADK